NTGNTTLTGVTITDANLGTLDCNQPASLAPGDHITCTGSHTLTQADNDPGQVVNTASADSSQTRPTDTEETGQGPKTTALALAKDGDLITTVVEPDGRADAGDRIDYTITATNTGNTTLTDVTVTDSLLTNLSCMPSVPAASLAPDSGITCTGTHTLT